MRKRDKSSFIGLELPIQGVIVKITQFDNGILTGRPKFHAEVIKGNRRIEKGSKMTVSTATVYNFLKKGGATDAVTGK